MQQNRWGHGFELLCPLSQPLLEKEREEEIGLMRAWVEAMGKVKTRSFIRC